MKEKKFCTILAGVLLFLTFIPLFFYSALLVINFFGQKGDNIIEDSIIIFFVGIPALIFSFIIFGMGISSLIFGIKLIKLGRGGNKLYNSDNGYIVGYTLYESFLLFAMIIAINFTTTEYLLYSYYILIAFLVLSIILMIIDKITFSIKKSKGKIVINKTTTQFVPNKINVMQAELNKLNEMKEDKLISEEEYSKLREAIIEKHNKDN